MPFLRVFGCLCLMYIPWVKQDKLDKKVGVGLFIVYNTISKAYKVFHLEIETITICRDV